MRTIYLIFGFIFLGLAILGIVLPILPTTPFLMLSAFLFAKSYKKIDIWFKSTKIYKNNLETFHNKGQMKKCEKIRIIITITIVMLIAFIMMKNTLIGRISISIVWILHIIAFVFIIKTDKT